MELHTLKILLLVAVALSLGAADEANDRIKGPGTMNASPGEFKYLAKIRNKATNKLIGSGILLRSKVVLAIGYNYLDLEPSDIIVVLGEYDRTDDSTSQEIDVKTIKIHPQSVRTGGVYGDVALMQLVKKPKLGKKFLVKTFGVQNIISTDEDEEILGNSDSCVVPGYGLTEWTEDETKLPRKLKKFVPQMQKQQTCATVAGEYYRRKKYLCSVNDNLTAVCKFDGGDPLLCMKDGKMKLYGLTIGGTLYCSEGFSFFTRTSTFYLWIKRNAHMLQN